MRNRLGEEDENYSHQLSNGSNNIADLRYRSDGRLESRGDDISNTIDNFLTKNNEGSSMSNTKSSKKNSK